MKRRTHRPPSKVRYDQTHPTVSVRVTRELYDQLEDLRERSGKSLGDILREALKQQAPSARKAYELGYNAAKREFAVSYKCSVCGGNMTVTTAGEKEAIGQYMREHGCRHGECVH